MSQINRICLKRNRSQDYEDYDKENEFFDFSEYDQEPRKIDTRFCVEYISKEAFELTGLMETEEALNNLKKYLEENPTIYHEILKKKKIYEIKNSGLIGRIKHMVYVALRKDYLENIISKVDFERKLKAMFDGMTKVQNTNKRIRLEDGFRENNNQSLYQKLVSSLFSEQQANIISLPRPPLHPNNLTTPPCHRVDRPHAAQTTSNFLSPPPPPLPRNLFNSAPLPQSPTRKNNSPSSTNTSTNTSTNMSTTSRNVCVEREKASYLSSIKDGKKSLKKTEIERTPRGTPVLNPSMDPSNPPMNHSSLPTDHAGQLTSCLEDALRQRFCHLDSPTQSIMDHTYNSFSE